LALPVLSFDGKGYAMIRYGVFWRPKHNFKWKRIRRWFLNVDDAKRMIVKLRKGYRIICGHRVYGKDFDFQIRIFR